MSNIQEKETILAFQFIDKLHQICNFQSTEGLKCGKASKSNIRRWFEQKSVVINNSFPKWNEYIEYPITQLILFPNSNKRKITIL